MDIPEGKLDHEALRSLLEDLLSGHLDIHPERQLDRVPIYRPVLENIKPQDNVFGAGTSWRFLLPEVLERTSGTITIALSDCDDWSWFASQDIPERVRLWNGTNFKFFGDDRIDIGFLFGCLTQATVGNINLGKAIDRVESVCTDETRIYAVDFHMKASDLENYVKLTFEDPKVQDDYQHFVMHYQRGGSRVISALQGNNEVICSLYSAKEFFARYFGKFENFYLHNQWEFSETNSGARGRKDRDKVENNYRQYFKKLKFESQTTRELPDEEGKLAMIKVTDVKSGEPVEMDIVEEMIWTRSPESTSVSPKERENAAKGLKDLMARRRGNKQ